MTLRPALTALTAALVLTLLTGPAMAQWKWKDANGRITVSDLPPPRDVPPQNILQRPEPTAARAPAVSPAASAASAPAVAPRVDRELQARKDAAAQEQAAKEKAEAAKLAEQRAENCRNARAHLAALDSGQRIARYNEKGEREILDDRQRAAETRRAREVIASDCR
ncbi:MAG: DUF4124 domain-containing protein [Burkholderiaceae bacterium]|nr:DUF4124 domain-containing protein [Burkholderiaceae bacterium]